MTRRSRTVPLFVAALALPLLSAPAAYAGDDDVERRGSCSGNAEWKLKVGPEDGRLEVEGEVDSNRNGQVWRWRIKHNGSISARGKATTGGDSGSFEVRRVMTNLAGTDTFVFRAKHRPSGQVCRGKVRY